MKAGSDMYKNQISGLRLLVAAAAVLLTACGDKAPSPINSVYALENTYEAALILAVRYNELPRCGTPASPPLCSDAGAVGQIRKANTAARITLDLAVSAARDAKLTTDAKQAAADQALNALQAFQAVTALYAAPKGK